MILKIFHHYNLIRKICEKFLNKFFGNQFFNPYSYVQNVSIITLINMKIKSENIKK